MMDFDKNFLMVCEELEALDENFVIKDIPEDHGNIWLPSNEVRLWQIPRETGRLLRLLTLIKKPSCVLELGTSAGYSTIWLASGIQGIDAKVYTVEATQLKIDLARTTFEKARLQDRIVQIKGEIYEVLKDWNRVIDFVFLDADKMNYYGYIKLIEPYLSLGAVVVADNVSDYGELMKDYLAYITVNTSFISELMQIGDGLMVSVKIK